MVMVGELPFKARYVLRRVVESMQPNLAHSYLRQHRKRRPSGFLKRLAGCIQCLVILAKCCEYLRTAVVIEFRFVKSLKQREALNGSLLVTLLGCDLNAKVNDVRIVHAKTRRSTDVILGLADEPLRQIALCKLAMNRQTSVSTLQCCSIRSDRVLEVSTMPSKEAAQKRTLAQKTHACQDLEFIVCTRKITELN